jgi:hypothetical protein
MSNSRPTRTALKILVVSFVAIAVAGCTGTKTSGKLPSSSGSGAASAVSSAPVSTAVSPLSSVPSLSPTATAASDDSQAAAATAFLNDYFAALNTALATGNTQKVTPLYASTCLGCASSVDSIVKAQALQEKFVGGAITVVSAKVLPSTTKTRTDIAVVTREAAGKIVTATGAVVSSFDLTAPVATVYTLSPQGTSWIILTSRPGIS